MRLETLSLTNIRVLRSPMIAGAVERAITVLFCCHWESMRTISETAPYTAGAVDSNLTFLLYVALVSTDCFYAPPGSAAYR